MFERFTEGAVKVIMVSQEEARRMGHNFLGTEQLLLGILGQKLGVGARVLRESGITLRKARKEVQARTGPTKGYMGKGLPFTPRVKRVLDEAIEQGKKYGQNYVGTEHVLLALIEEKDGIAVDTLRKLGGDIDELREKTVNLTMLNQENFLEQAATAEEHRRKMDEAKWKKENENKKYKQPKPIIAPTLEQYSKNMTKRAADGLVDPVVGRNDETQDVIRALSRRGKNNPILVGEPGVGKTAVAEGLARLIAEDTVPTFLKHNSLMDLSLGSLLAGTKYRGEFEERLKRVVEEAENDDYIVLVIDEIHTLVGAGAAEGAVDAANLLKPPLARGKLRCIGATTKAEYKKYIERDPALERRFQPIRVEEPSIKDAIEIVRGVKGKYETHHGLTYTSEAIVQSVILSDKYIADRFLPDKAIDLIDEAAATVGLEVSRTTTKKIHLVIEELRQIKLNKEKSLRIGNYEQAIKDREYEHEIHDQLTIMKNDSKLREQSDIKEELSLKVTEEDISKIVAKWTGIPVTKVSKAESKELLNMENILHERLIGQHRAIISISKAIRRARVGLRNPTRPIASFLFAGPTGVGKTELTKALANYMFGGDDSMIRLDMSEYMEKHTVAKLIGSPPGYVGHTEGGQLTEAVRAKPYTVILFDEVEKAHNDVFNLLLQILDDGRLTDSRGRLVDFKNTIVILTSNIGAQVIEEESGLKHSIQDQKKEEKSGLKKGKRFDRGYMKEATSEAMAAIREKHFGEKPEKNKKEEKQMTAIERIRREEENKKNEELAKRMSDLVNIELKKFFRPEFLNRLDEIIIFQHLTKQNIEEIATIMINELIKRMEDKDVKLVVKPCAKRLIVDKGYNPIYGARPLRRAVMSLLEDNLAEQCLSQTLHPGTELIVWVDYDNKVKVDMDYSKVSTSLLNAALREEEEEDENVFQ